MSERDESCNKQVLKFYYTQKDAFKNMTKTKQIYTRIAYYIKMILKSEVIFT